MIDLEITSILAFFSFIAILIIIDRKNIEFNYGLVIKKWKGGKKQVDAFVNKHKKALIFIGNLEIIIATLSGVLGFILLISFSFKLQQAYALVLPTVGGYQIPGPVFSIPFWFWIVAIFIVITAHEPMHAIFSRLAKVPVKDYGILLFFLLPIGAFVDPDMKKVAKLKFAEKLRIYTAGSFGNFVTALAFFLILILSANVVNALIMDSGVKFVSVIANTPAEEVRLSGIILQINNTTINSRKDLALFLNKTKPGETIKIKTTTGIFVLKTIENPDFPGNSFIGISNVTTAFKYKMLFKDYVPEFVISSLIIWNNLLIWIIIINIGVGVANMLPLKPFDGGYVFEEIFKKLLPQKGNFLINIISLITFSLILFNLFGIGILKSLI